MTASFNINDDLVDGSLVRWDKPSWYKLPDVGLSSVFDAVLLENVVYHVLRQQFKGSPCYEELVDLFLDTSFGAYLGQNNDKHISKPGVAMDDDFTMEGYETAARLKTSGILFYSPTVAAMITSGVQDAEAYAAARDISLDLSVVLQIQDDYNDCFGDDESELNADIRNGSCTWMILEAKRIANANQKNILKDNYGYDDQSKIDAVKEVFNELRLKDRVQDYRRIKFQAIEAKIENAAQVIPPNIYKYALEIVQGSSVEFLQRNQVE